MKEIREIKKSLKGMIEIYEGIAKSVPALLNEEKYLKAKELLESKEKETKCGVCLVCGEFEEIEFGDIDIIDENCYQRCHCKKCNTDFDDIFKYEKTILS